MAIPGPSKPRFIPDASIRRASERILVYILVQALGGTIRPIVREKGMPVYVFKFKRRLPASIFIAMIKNYMKKYNADIIAKLKPGQMRGNLSPQAEKYYKRGRPTAEPPYYVTIEKWERK